MELNRITHVIQYYYEKTSDTGPFDTVMRKINVIAALGGARL